ncbi:MAG: alkaline phosphatase family protein [Anaerolineae bacterium]
MDVHALENDLRTYRPVEFEHLPTDFVWPRYEGLSVGNVPATLAHLLGVRPYHVLPPLRGDLLDDLADGVRHVVLVLIDGLGWEQLQRMLMRDDTLVFHRLAERGRLLPLTSLFPSTTNSVLATLRTGVPPVRHGLLAYELYLREWHMAVECITFSPLVEPGSERLKSWGLEPESFLPVPSLAQMLSVQGVLTYQIIAQHLADGTLSQMYFRGMREVYTHFHASDLWYTVREVLRRHRRDRFLLSVYWSAVDTLAHHHGPRHGTALNEVRTLSYLMERSFLDALEPMDREGTLLLMLADHGQITTPAERGIVLEDHPALAEMLRLPTLGESRAPFFYPRAGYLDDVRAYLSDHFAEQMLCLAQEEVLESGLLGPGEPYAEVQHRLGDLVGLMKGNAAFARDEDHLKRLSGRHGGLGAAEMLVPLLAVRLDAL